jgi:hypothetical protein
VLPSLFILFYLLFICDFFIYLFSVLYYYLFMFPLSTFELQNLEQIVLEMQEQLDTQTEKTTTTLQR